MLTKFTVVIILQCVLISNYLQGNLDSTMFCVNYISIKLKKKSTIGQVKPQFYIRWSISISQSVQSLSCVLNRSMPGLPVHHQLPEFTQTHVHRIGDAIQLSHPLRPLPLLPPIPPSIRVFSNESTLHIRWPKYWRFSFSISPSDEHPGLISFRMDWLDLLAVQGTLQKSSPTPQFKSINSLALSFLHSSTLTSIHDHWKNYSLDQMDLCWRSNISAFMGPSKYVQKQYVLQLFGMRNCKRNACSFL